MVGQAHGKPGDRVQCMHVHARACSHVHVILLAHCPRYSGLHALLEQAFGRMQLGSASGWTGGSKQLSHAPGSRQSCSAHASHMAGGVKPVKSPRLAALCIQTCASLSHLGLIPFHHQAQEELCTQSQPAAVFEPCLHGPRASPSQVPAHRSCPWLSAQTLPCRWR